MLKKIYIFLIALETDFNVAKTLNGSVSVTAINVAFMAAESTQNLFAPPSRSKKPSKWCVKNAVLFLHTVVLISVNILLPTKNPMLLKMKESHEKKFAHILGQFKTFCLYFQSEGINLHCWAHNVTQTKCAKNNAHFLQSIFKYLKKF